MPEHTGADPSAMILIAFLKVFEKLLNQLIDKFLGSINSSMSGDGITDSDGLTDCYKWILTIQIDSFFLGF